jgi:predicted peroxiredoxin
MVRRSLLSRLAGLPFFAFGASQAQAPPKKLKVMMKSAWGPDDPTRAAFPFIHGLVLAEAGHDVQIFLLAEATTLLRKSMVSAIFPVGWPPLSETLQKIADKHIPVFA